MTKESPLALAALAGFALTGAPALAGGLGVATTAGMHQEVVHWYDAAGEQYEPANQFRPTWGGGLQIVLGDKDDRVQGLVKFYGIFDAPPTDPSENADDIVAIREETRSTGYASAGIQWGLFGDPDAFMFCLNTSLGSGFLTSDMLEYADAEVGPAFTYMLADTLQLTGELTGHVRYRKRFTAATGVGVGVRYLFD